VKKAIKSWGLEIDLTVKKRNKTLSHRCALGLTKSLSRLCGVYKKQSQNESNLLFFFFFSLQTFSFLFGKMSLLYTFAHKLCLNQEESKPPCTSSMETQEGCQQWRNSRELAHFTMWSFLLLASSSSPCPLHFAGWCERADPATERGSQGVTQLKKQVKVSLRNVSMSG
jgi:hypothetical protein